jgi:hypothetical protein
VIHATVRFWRKADGRAVGTGSAQFYCALLTSLPCLGAISKIGTNFPKEVPLRSSSGWHNDLKSPLTIASGLCVLGVLEAVSVPLPLRLLRTVSQGIGVVTLPTGLAVARAARRYVDCRII